jgi:nicotinamide-nucleotide amidase
MGLDESPRTEMIAIGTELLLGHVTDTNSQDVAQELAGIGIHLSHITMVRDELDHIVEVLGIGLARSDVLIITGGLGPTEDDLTRDAVANGTGQRLIFRDDLMKDIEAFFNRRGFRMVASNRKQAQIPRGAHPIKNPIGTAPGFILEDPRGIIIALPGVPREMKYLLKSAVVPFLRRRFRLGRQVVLTRVLRVTGLGESGVDRQIKDLIRDSQNPRIGLCASVGDIRILIACRAGSRLEANRLIDPVEEEIRARLQTLVYGVDHETLEQKVAEELHRLDLSVAVAEAITGGHLCHIIQRTGTRAFVQGFVLPSKKGQISFLGLSGRTFSALIRNPEAWAEALSRRLLDYAEVGLSIAGNFKPLKEEMVGTLAISIAQGRESSTRSWKIGGIYDGVSTRASIMALDMLRRYLLEKHGADADR